MGPYHKPPAYAKKLLFSFLRNDLAEEVEGDLEERFYSDLKRKSHLRAKLNYWYQVINYLRPFALRKSIVHFNRYDMFQSNMKVAVRSLWRHKASTFINLFGLTVGLSSCLLIGLYLQNEYSFDTFQDNRKRTVRLIMEYGFDGSTEIKRGNYTSTKVAPTFSRTFPEVEAAVRMTDSDVVVWNNDVPITETRFMYADSSFFDVFHYEWLQGNASNALHGARKVVLTQSAAQKYFGNESPLGKTLLTGSDRTPYEVTGVMKDYPSNSQFTFDFLASFSSLGVNQEETYFNANYTTYVLLKNIYDLAPLQEKVTTFMSTEMKGSGATINFLLEPFDQIHLHSPYQGFVPNTSITYLYILMAVGFLILMIVCFTYINLSTARSIERAKEVGVRKVVGADKSQLFWQFIGESTVLCVMSIVLSVGVVMFALPYFNLLTEKHLEMHALTSPVFLTSAFVITMVVSLLAGSYPAVILSGFQPVRVLKGVFKNTNSGKRIQQSLIVFQFVISAFLIVSTIIIQNQLYYIQHKDVGYDREQILVLPMKNKMLEQLSVIKKELKSNAEILNVSRCVSTPVRIVGGYSMRTAEMPENTILPVIANPIDEEYVKTTGLEIIAGRDFSEQDMKDADRDSLSTFHFILNESAARELGWSPEAAIGRKMFLGDHRPGIIEGVVRDFHFESMHQSIKPLVLFTEMRGYGQLLVKIRSSNVPSTVSFVEGKWKQLVPYFPFEYRFLDDDYNKLYQSELQLGTIMSLFAGIAIVLACIGLFGLSSHIVQQRLKEVSIRKVLGASVLDIAAILSGSFVKLVLIAIVIAIPIAYLIIDRWLEDFAYRVAMSWWTFALAGLVVIIISLVTVSFQSIKAAWINPATTLKSE